MTNPNKIKHNRAEKFITDFNTADTGISAELAQAAFWLIGGSESFLMLAAKDNLSSNYINSKELLGDKLVPFFVMNSPDIFDFMQKSQSMAAMRMETGLGKTVNDVAAFACNRVITALIDAYFLEFGYQK